MAKPFDVAGKELLQRYPRDWLAMIGWPVPADDGGLAIVDSDLSTSSPVADKLVRVDGVPVPYVAHVEFQSTSGGDLDGRMLHYNVLVRHHHRRPVRSVALLFRPAATAGVTGRFAEQLDDESWLTFAYRRVNLWQLPTDQLLAGPLGTVPLAPITVDESRVQSVIRQVGRRLGAELARGPMADILEVTRNLLGVRFDEHQRELLMPTSLQKLIEEESWTYKQTVQRGLERGLAEGRAEGRGEGRAEGRVEGRHEQLIEQGADKFGPISDEVAARIRAITDLADLRRLASRLLQVDSWDALLADG